jgi:hypothetical protein
MKEPLRRLLFIGLKAAGSYDPEVVLPHIEERLTVGESDAVQAFLRWCHENKRTFGRANLDIRFLEFQRSGMSR